VIGLLIVAGLLGAVYLTTRVIDSVHKRNLEHELALATVKNELELQQTEVEKIKAETSRESQRRYR
jgi:hypothetical protein